MTKSQILCFVEVAKHHSFSSAAAHMFISQPAVSKHVANLEEYLGLILVERTPTGIQLTGAGMLLYEYFCKTINDLNLVLDEARRVSVKEAGSIRLGCLDGWDISAFYPELRGILKTKYPELKLGLNGYNHIQLVDALRRGEIDVGISLEIAFPLRSSLFKQNITTAPTILLISSQHPLAQKQDLSLAELRNEPFYVIAPVERGENPMERLTFEICESAGFTPIIEHVPSSAAVLMRLQSGVGGQITCAWTGACKLPTYRTIEIDYPLNISAAWMQNGRNPAKHIFVEELCRHYQKSREDAAE